MLQQKPQPFVYKKLYAPQNYDIGQGALWRKGRKGGDWMAAPAGLDSHFNTQVRPVRALHGWSGQKQLRNLEQTTQQTNARAEANLSSMREWRALR